MRDYTNTSENFLSRFQVNQIFDESASELAVQSAWEDAALDPDTGKGKKKRPVFLRALDIIGMYNILRVIANGVPEDVVAARLRITKPDLMMWINEDPERTQAYMQIRQSRALDSGFSLIEDLVSFKAVMEKAEVATAKVRLMALDMARKVILPVVTTGDAADAKAGVTVNISFGNAMMPQGRVIEHDPSGDD